MTNEWQYYQTEWDSESLHGQVYSVTDDGDLPMAGMNTNACEHTSCPIHSSARQTYNYTLQLAKKFPVVSDNEWQSFIYLSTFKMTNFADFREHTPSNGCFVIRPNQRPHRTNVALQPELS